MATAAQRRWALWTPLLMASAYLALWGDKTPDTPNTRETAEAISMPMPPAVVRSPAPRAERGPLRQPAASLAALVPRDVLIPLRSRDQPGVDLFYARSWRPPASANAGGESAPVMPTFPYAYVGKKWEDGVWEVYLSRGNVSFVARVGATLEGLYEVEQIVPPVLTVKYKPLGQRQTLGIGEFAE